MLRKEREEEVRMQQMQRDAAVLTMEFTKPSGATVKVLADGRKVTQQTPLALRKESAAEEVNFKSELMASLVVGSGDDQRTFCCKVEDLILDTEQEKQWKQLGQEASGLRLQVKFVKRCGTARHRPAPPGTAGTTRHHPAPHSTAQHRTAPHSTAQHSSPQPPHEPTNPSLPPPPARRTHGVKANFAIADIRATIPSGPSVIAAPTRAATA
jgi:hypothetical protein